jgi:O-acetyl-ADP-ribose deacetylase (regulator of RNase III)
MLREADGDLLEAPADAVVNAVNTVGVMGKGIALQFKQVYPENFRAYAAACRCGEVQLGSMFVVETGLPGRPRPIINFPTKKHWRNQSRLADIKSGLVDLRRVIGDRAVAPSRSRRLAAVTGDWTGATYAR